MTILMKLVLAGLLAFSLSSTAPAQTVAPGGAVPDLAAEAARDYRERARFPAWSNPVPANAADPVREGRRPTRQSLPNAGGGRLTVWASDMRFEPGETAVLYADLSPASAKDRDIPDNAPFQQGIKARDWTVTATVTGRESGVLGTVAYRDDGRGADARRGDGIYSAAFTLPEAAAPAVGRAENVAVMVTAQTGENAEAEEYKALGGFLYSHPAAQLSGAFEDVMVDGNLVIRAQAEVIEAGRFHLSGTLYSLQGEPVATAQIAVELTQGGHWIDLTFYGLALSERGANGPYRLGSVSLATTGSLPNALGSVLENAHRTGPYFAEEFHRRAFERPGLVGAAERLERASRDQQSRRP